jgi:hypothetical protein
MEIIAVIPLRRSLDDIGLFFELGQKYPKAKISLLSSRVMGFFYLVAEGDNRDIPMGLLIAAAELFYLRADQAAA